jgi:hypothetical protein
MIRAFSQQKPWSKKNYKLCFQVLTSMKSGTDSEDTANNCVKRSGGSRGM